MKSFFNILNKNNSNNVPSEAINNNEHKTKSVDKIEQYKDEMKNKNKPFRLSALLHNVTNKVKHLIKDHKHMIYYDIESDVGRYIVGDMDNIEQVLEILIKDAFSLNEESKVILKISYKNKFLVFDVMNEKGLIDKNTLGQYTDVKQILSTQDKNVNTFVNAKMISESMDGMLTLKSSRISGTHYVVTLPYCADNNDKNHKEELRSFLTNKKALFICKDKYDTQRMQYILQIYGVNTNTMKATDFVSKKPNLSRYDMVIIHSEDLSYKHISFFKSMSHDEKNHFKLIIVNELFEDKEKINLVKSIADAELYKPIIIGDVEEILYQLFITKSKSIKGINNIDIFDSKAFIIKGNNQFEEDYLTRYKGAHIAIVTDSIADENILQNILMKDGIRLFCMRNGFEMIDLLEDEEIDIIFADINMPIMDGVLLTKKIRSMKKCKKIPIVSISSISSQNELKKMEQVGINATITKPIESKDIYTALEKFLIMTERICMRKDKNTQITFSFNKEILDVEKGISASEKNVEYLQSLLKTYRYLKDRRDMFENMIHNQEYIALRKLARDMQFLCETIYATAMIKMFKDLNYFMLQPKKIYLVDYISIYEENLEALGKEVKNYINSSQ